MSPPLKFRIHDPSQEIVRPFDFTKLSAFSTCPRFGGFRYVLNRIATERRNGAPNMALQAGSASHDVFAAVRLLDAYESNTISEDQFYYHGTRLFGDDRLNSAWNAYDQAIRDGEEKHYCRRQFCLDFLYTFGYVEDNYDKSRTLDSVVQACRGYIDRWRWGKKPIWVAGPARDDLIGIEVPFAIDVLDPDNNYILGTFTGRIDGVHVNTINGQPYAEENKTGKRINDVWVRSFITSHQPTGYMVALMMLCNDKTLSNISVVGLQIPEPRTGPQIETMIIDRAEHQLVSWAEWVKHVLYELWLPYEDDNFVRAPMYTHSCDRYFQTCQFIYHCAEDPATLKESLQELSVDRWSPLD